MNEMLINAVVVTAFTVALVLAGVSVFLPKRAKMLFVKAAVFLAVTTAASVILGGIIFLLVVLWSSAL